MVSNVQVSKDPTAISKESPALKLCKDALMTGEDYDKASTWMFQPVQLSP